MNIRQRLPKYEEAPKGAPADERKAVIERNKALEKEQIQKNFTAILDAVLEEHPDETLEVLALCCFVEPENVDDYSVSDYIKTFTELISDEAVMGFFTSLAPLVNANTANASLA
jgi:hypothetical protein